MSGPALAPAAAAAPIGPAAGAGAACWPAPAKLVLCAVGVVLTPRLPASAPGRGACSAAKRRLSDSPPGSASWDMTVPPGALSGRGDWSEGEGLDAKADTRTIRSSSGRDQTDEW